MPAPVPLVLVPGLLCTAALFAPQIAALSGLTSVTTADHTRHDSMAAIARDILAAAPPRFALAGLSMGVSIALEILRQAPARVERLALLDGRAELDNAETQGEPPDLSRDGAARPLHRDHPRPSAAQADPSRAPGRMRRWCRSFSIWPRRRAPPPSSARKPPCSTANDYTPLLPEIRCPTLVIVGEADAITPVPMVQAMARNSRRAAGGDRRQRPSLDFGTTGGDDGVVEGVARLASAPLVFPLAPRRGERVGVRGSQFQWSVDRHEHNFISPAPSSLVAATPSPNPLPPSGGEGDKNFGGRGR